MPRSTNLATPLHDATNIQQNKILITLFILVHSTSFDSMKPSCRRYDTELKEERMHVFKIFDKIKITVLL